VTKKRGGGGGRGGGGANWFPVCTAKERAYVLIPASGYYVS
jgi:hypothetical protein